MPFRYSSKTVTSGDFFTLPGGSDLDADESFTLSATNAVSIPDITDPATGNNLRAFAALSMSVLGSVVGADDNGFLGLFKTFIGYGGPGVSTPDGKHYTSTSGAIYLPDGIASQLFAAYIVGYDGTGDQIDVTMVTGNNLELSLPVGDPSPPPPTPPPPDTLNPPSNLIATREAGGDVRLSWTDNSSNEIGFGIQCRNIMNGADINPAQIDPTIVGAYPQDDATWIGLGGVDADVTTYLVKAADIAGFHLDVIPSDQAVFRIYGYNALVITPFVAVMSSLVTLVSVAPPAGGTLGLDPVSLIGTGFQDGCVVTFDGLEAFDVVRVDETSITCICPAHAEGSVDVVVQNPDGSNATLTDGYVYTLTISTPVPHVGGVQTAKGPLPSVITTHATIKRGLNNGTIVYAWTAAATNPAATTFGSPAALNTTITFGTYVPGRYVFTLTARDEGDNFAGTDELIIVVPVPTPPTIHITNPGPVGSI